MPLQNRVDAHGEIHAVPVRGLFTGNRGIIHDPQSKTLLRRRWASKAWITCALEFKDMKREPMGRNRAGGKAGWTELFFLDEVTALAAGHRPCFYCRRRQAKTYSSLYGRAFNCDSPSATEIDARLHGERLASGGKAVEIDQPGLSRLPDGAMFSAGANDYAIRNGQALRWSFSGYGPELGLNDVATGEMYLLTPATTLAVLQQGYRPVWHPSAGA